MRSAQPGPNNPEPVSYNPNEFWLRTLLRWYIGLVIRPSPTIREIVGRRAIWAGPVTLLVVLIVNIIFSIPFVASSIGEGSVSFDEALAIRSVILGDFVVITVLVTLSLVLSLLTHAFARLLGGTGIFVGMWSGLMFLNILVLFNFVFSTAFTLVNSYAQWSPQGVQGLSLPLAALRLLVFLWMFVLAFILVRENYQLTTGRAVVSWLGASAVVFVIVAVPILLFLLLLYGLGSSMGYGQA